MKFPSFVTGIVLVGSAGVFGYRGGNVAMPRLLAAPSRPRGRSGTQHASVPLAKRNTFPSGGVNITEGTFQQLIDHSNPSLGTFTQRIWWTADHYGGDGSPVVVFTPATANASDYVDYLSNKTITGVLAKAIGGAAIVYEARYTGESTPFTWYTTANMSYNTIKNHALDATYLAKNVQLPFDTKRSSTPDKAPWIFASGTFGGALVAWTKVLQPDTYWAYLASSASVEDLTDLSAYYDVIQTHGPRNCTADVNKVIDYMDNVFETGTKEQIHALMDKFGFGALAHPVDMMAALAEGPQGWDYQYFSDESRNYSRPYFDWCDYVENVWPASGNKTPGAEGVGLDKALEGYAKWSKDVLINGSCNWYAENWGYTDWKGDTNVQCFDTFNASSPFYTDRYYKHDGDTLSFTWLQCNEPLEWWVNGAPKGKPALASRLIDTPYWRRQCSLSYPAQNAKAIGINAGKTAADVNKLTGGWDVSPNASRIIFSVGEYENWLPTTVVAKERPGGPLASTDHVPVFVVPRGPTSSDLLTVEADVNNGTKAVVDKEMATLTAWVKDFYGHHNIARDFVY